MKTLYIRGASHHNLHHLDLDLPLGQWIAVIGPSGSGKSSLVRDTIVREGSRRHLATLSPRARRSLSKLGRADARLSNLPVVISVDTTVTKGSRRSTVGTQTGVLDLLRLWFARHSPHTRSAFSFNHPAGACETCDGSGVQDVVDPNLLINDPNKSIRDGALIPTLKNGYTVYSQVTIDVLNSLCEAHGFTVDTPWSALTNDQRHMVFYGTRVFEVAFGKHSLASRLKWKGITAKPRDTGFYKGLIPVIEETLKRNRNPNILRFVRSIPCPTCNGSRLGLAGRTTTVHGHTLPHLLDLPVHTLLPTLDSFPPDPIGRQIFASIRPRLARQISLGLGHLSLARCSLTLSSGEAQRLRLVVQLSLELSGILFALDEPTLGLHPCNHRALVQALEDIRSQGNTILTVEHDPDMVRHSDYCVELGPGGGTEGGRLVFAGPTPPNPLGTAPTPKTPRPHREFLSLEGATLHNLRGDLLRVPLRALTVVTGPSGAGKSSLIFGTLLPALRGEQGAYTKLTGPPLPVLSITADPIGKNPRSTPATYTGLFDKLRRAFANTPEARSRGWTATRFSYNTKTGRCPTCEGLGMIRIPMHLLTDLEHPCDACGGSRYAPEISEVTLGGYSIQELLQCTAAEAVERLPETLRPIPRALVDLGLPYLRLGQSSTTLSRGEAQRVRLASLLATPSKPRILLLDEPDRGLHPTDVRRLLHTLDQLIDAGDTVIAISHHRHMWAAADHLLAVENGQITENPSISWAPLSAPHPPRPPILTPTHIHLRGVRTHNLHLNVQLPHGKLTAIVGPSGSGKSSLAIATLAAEAARRFAETLPFQARRFLRQLPQPVLEHAHGLTPTLVLSQLQPSTTRRSTLATSTPLGEHLRLLYSRVSGSLSMSSFSPNTSEGACPSCGGLGTEARCDPDRLIVDPGLSLAKGALGNGTIGKHFGGGKTLATLETVSQGITAVPWRDLSAHLQHVALHGCGAETFEVRWEYTRGKRSGVHSFVGPWEGLCTLVEEEARRRIHAKTSAKWRDSLVDRPCGVCEGSRLQPAAAAFEVCKTTLPALSRLPLTDVLATLEGPPSCGHEAAVLARLLPELRPLLTDLIHLGLGDLHLWQPVGSLSASTYQRLRLANLLQHGTTGHTIILDEPSAFLSEVQLTHLLDRLHHLRDQGCTVVVVTHREAMIRGSDFVVELGPGAGEAGGTVVASGPTATVLSGESLTARMLRRAHPPLPPQIEVADSSDYRIVGVTGPRSEQVLRGLSGVIPSLTRGSVAKALGIDRVLAERAAKVAGRSMTTFLLGHPRASCPNCKGRGTRSVALDALGDLELMCAHCEGRGLNDDALTVELDGRNLAEILSMTTEEYSKEYNLPNVSLDGFGLSHLHLGRAVHSLSTGEHQRLALAAALTHKQPRVFVVSALGAGLHGSDLDRLFQAIPSRHRVVCSTERRSVLARCDACVVTYSSDIT